MPLPELKLLDEDIVANASIRYGAVPEGIDGVVAHETQWWASRNEYLQRIPGVANFLVRNGCEVIVEEAGAPAIDIRAYLLSPIFSALCHQAGMYALHASSVRVGDGVAAFLGHSGYGKSTLAAHLARRGYAVISDDNCLLDPEGGAAETLVVPVAPALKLWRNAVEQLGVEPEGLERVFSQNEKYRLRVSEVEERLPLRSIFFLEWAEEADAPVRFTEVTGVLAVIKLMEFTVFDYLMKATERQSENFALTGRLLSQARAYTLSRPKDFGRMDEVVEALEGLLVRHGPEEI
jgi:hypothetical protein